MPNISDAVIRNMLSMLVLPKAAVYSGMPSSVWSASSSARIVPKPICGIGTSVTLAETATAGIR